jgi:hypothetical protein
LEGEIFGVFLFCFVLELGFELRTSTTLVTLPA